MAGVVSDSGTGHGQGSDVGQRIQIGGAAAVTNPEALLAGSLKAGVVSLAFGTQGICALEVRTFPVNGKTVVRGNRFVLGAALMLLVVIPVFVVAGASSRFGLPERAAEFLADAVFVSVKNLSIFSHGKTSIADKAFRGQFVWVLGIALIQRDNGIALVDILHQVVDRFHIVTLVAQKGTFVERQNGIGSGKYPLHNGRIRHVSGGGQLIERQAGNTVHQHMVLVAPVKLNPSLIVLIGCGVNAQGAVRVGFGVVCRIEFTCSEGFRIVLLRICRNRCRVQADKGSIQNAQLVKLLHLFRHDVLQLSVVQLFKKSVICPVRWQLFHDVESAVVSDKPIVIQIIC